MVLEFKTLYALDTPDLEPFFWGWYVDPPAMPSTEVINDSRLYHLYYLRLDPNEHWTRTPLTNGYEIPDRSDRRARFTNLPVSEGAVAYNGEEVHTRTAESFTSVYSNPTSSVVRYAYSVGPPPNRTVVISLESTTSASLGLTVGSYARLRLGANREILRFRVIRISGNFYYIVPTDTNGNVLKGDSIPRSIPVGRVLNIETISIASYQLFTPAPYDVWTHYYWQPAEVRGGLETDPSSNLYIETRTTWGRREWELEDTIANKGNKTNEEIREEIRALLNTELADSLTELNATGQFGSVIDSSELPADYDYVYDAQTRIIRTRLVDRRPPTPPGRQQVQIQTSEWYKTAIPSIGKQANESAVSNTSTQRRYIDEIRVTPLNITAASTVAVSVNPPGALSGVRGQLSAVKYGTEGRFNLYYTGAVIGNVDYVITATWRDERNTSYSTELTYRVRLRRDAPIPDDPVDLDPEVFAFTDGNNKTRTLSLPVTSGTVIPVLLQVKPVSSQANISYSFSVMPSTNYSIANGTERGSAVLTRTTNISSPTEEQVSIMCEERRGSTIIRTARCTVNINYETESLTAPALPTGFTAREFLPLYVELSWTRPVIAAGITTPTRWQIQRRELDPATNLFGIWSETVEVNNVVSTIVGPLDSGTGYEFRLRAGRESAPWSSWTAGIPVTTSEDPTDGLASSIAPLKPTLSFTPNVNGTVDFRLISAISAAGRPYSFRLEWKLSGNSSAPFIRGNVTFLNDLTQVEGTSSPTYEYNSSLINESFTPGITYDFRLVMINNIGNSPPSDVISIEWPIDRVPFPFNEDITTNHIPIGGIRIFTINAPASGVANWLDLQPAVVTAQGIEWNDYAASKVDNQNAIADIEVSYSSTNERRAFIRVRNTGNNVVDLIWLRARGNPWVPQTSKEVAQADLYGSEDSSSIDLNSTLFTEVEPLKGRLQNVLKEHSNAKRIVNPVFVVTSSERAKAFNELDVNDWVLYNGEYYDIMNIITDQNTHGLFRFKLQMVEAQGRPDESPVWVLGQSKLGTDTILG